MERWRSSSLWHQDPQLTAYPLISNCLAKSRRCLAKNRRCLGKLTPKCVIHAAPSKQKQSHACLLLLDFKRHTITIFVSICTLSRRFFFFLGIMSFNAQNIHSLSQSARQRTTAAPGSVFDVSQFKIQVGKDVPSEIIQSLQTEFGLNMGSGKQHGLPKFETTLIYVWLAIDKFYNMDKREDAPAHPEPPPNIPNGNEGVAPAEPVKLGNDDPLNRKEFVVKDQ